jgi:alkaline phosphatase D
MTQLLLGPLVGGLAHNRGYIWGRADGPAVLHAWISPDPSLAGAVLAGQSLPLSAADGFAGVAPLHNLAPGTRYYYALTLDDRPPSGGEYPSFTTFPVPGRPQPFAFAFGSCFRPAQTGAGRTFQALEQRRMQDDLQFLLMIGDQIYADSVSHNGLGRVACTLDEYRAVYLHTWSNPHLRSLLRRLPVFMTLDDHEVDDDWRWIDTDRREAYIPWWDRLERLLQGRSLPERRIPVERVQAALQAYWEHQGMHAPPHEIPLDLEPGGEYALRPGDPGSLAYTFNYGAAAFFILDTRTMRVVNRRQRLMLGEGQWQRLEQWLLAVKDAFPVKFLVSSAAVLFQMWIDFPRDRWSGFPDERRRLLSFLAAHGIEGVYILAGDLHSAHAVSVDLYGPGRTSIPLWEFCSSPFEQSANWFSKYAYQPLKGLPLKNQVRHFNLEQNNFGVVRVSFPQPGVPAVRFEAYGEDGELLAAAGDGGE